MYDARVQIGINASHLMEITEYKIQLVYHIERRLEEMKHSKLESLFIEDMKKDLSKYKTDISKFEKTINFASDVNTSLTKYSRFLKGLCGVIFSLILLIGFLSTRIIEIFPVILYMRLPVLTFAALLITLSGILFKESIVRNVIMALVTKKQMLSDDVTLFN